MRFLLAVSLFGFSMMVVWGGESEVASLGDSLGPSGRIESELRVRRERGKCERFDVFVVSLYNKYTDALLQEARHPYPVYKVGTQFLYPHHDGYIYPVKERDGQVSTMWISPTEHRILARAKMYRFGEPGNYFYWILFCTSNGVCVPAITRDPTQPQESWRSPELHNTFLPRPPVLEAFTVSLFSDTEDGEVWKETFMKGGKFLWREKYEPSPY